MKYIDKIRGITIPKLPIQNIGRMGFHSHFMKITNKINDIIEYINATRDTLSEMKKDYDTLVNPNWDAVEGEMGYIENKPTIPQADWNAASDSPDFIKNKPTIPQADWDAASGSPNFIKNKPTIPQADWNAASGSPDFIKNKPTIPQADWNAASGSPNFINNKPVIANANWNAAEGEPGYIENKPNLAGNAQPDWNAAADEPGHILNRPGGYTVDENILPETIVSLMGTSNPKIGGVALAKAPTPGVTYTVNFAGVEYQCEYKNGKIGNLGIEDGTDTGEPFLFYVESLSTGYNLEILANVNTSTVTLSIAANYNAKIPWDFLPFGYEEREVILPKTTLTFAPIEEMGGRVGAMITIPANFSEEHSQKITFNGTEYTYGSQNTGGSPGYGNISIMGGGEDTGEPFGIGVMQDMGIAIVFPVDPESTTGEIEWYQLVTAKLPENLLPTSEPVLKLDLTDFGQLSPSVKYTIPFTDVSTLVKAARTGLIHIKLIISLLGNDIFVPGDNIQSGMGGTFYLLFNVQRLDTDTYLFALTSFYNGRYIYMEYDHEEEALHAIIRQLAFTDGGTT